ncbi:putative neuraminidase [Anaerobacterium chartisolvens]|uniref:Putative neuraminidase n=1 Tax=Anaerobacterium chartisolvens TaxID=1297424 RepID=A0A369BI41_9FIRM|nr:sialidase family protein [Anaerobacterium chartisolvens]RCX19354.1 putative neuraminidase [Anaerobacterium chartisolvens]
MGKYLSEGKKKLVFPAGSMEFHICHASNICSLKNGSLIAAWFAGEKEGSDDIAIWGSRLEKARWSKPVKIAYDLEEPHWNPVLYQKDNGDVLLFYKISRKISEWHTKVKVSHDFGNTFSESEELVPGDRGGRGPVRCKVVTLSDGSMLAGNSIETGIWTAYADRSVDGGKTWTLSNAITIDVEYHGENTAENSDIEVSAQSFYGRGVIQPTLWESEEGHVHMLLRSTEGFIYRSDSSDFGCTWSKAYATQLPNNNSGIDVVKCEDGLLILCMNPVPKNWGPRTPIVLLTSEDNGYTWQQEAVLEDQAGEYSYPSIISTGDQVHVTYTYDRQSIAYWNFYRKEV